MVAAERPPRASDRAKGSGRSGCAGGRRDAAGSWPRAASATMVGMLGCLVTGLLLVLLFVLVPIPLWPFLVIGLVVLVTIAAALGLLRGIVGALFGRH